MVRTAAIVIGIVALLGAGCGDDGEKVSGPPPSAPGGLRVTSPDFDDGGAIPMQFTCDGENLTPAIEWSSPPAGTAELALLMEDPDAPGGTFVHWTVYSIDPNVRSLGREARAPDAATREGTNSFGEQGYGGPCPPKGSPHHYEFHVYALRSKLDLEAGAQPADVRAAVAKAAIAEGQLVGTYARRTD